MSVTVTEYSPAEPTCIEDELEPILHKNPTPGEELRVTESNGQSGSVLDGVITGCCTAYLETVRLLLKTVSNSKQEALLLKRQ
jgi:hypothetical protein